MALAGMIRFGIATAIQCRQWRLPLLKYESSSATSSGRPHTSSPSREPLGRDVIKTSRVNELWNLWTLILFEQGNILIRIGHDELKHRGLFRNSHARMSGIDKRRNLLFGGQARRNKLRKRRE